MYNTTTLILIIYKLSWDVYFNFSVTTISLYEYIRVYLFLSILTKETNVRAGISYSRSYILEVTKTIRSLWSFIVKLLYNMHHSIYWILFQDFFFIIYSWTFFFSLFIPTDFWCAWFWFSCHELISLIYIRIFSFWYYEKVPCNPNHNFLVLKKNFFPMKNIIFP